VLTITEHYISQQATSGVHHDSYATGNEDNVEALTSYLQLNGEILKQVPSKRQ
jgi:hypothetical protein